MLFKDDNHTDMCSVGKGCYIEHYLGRYCIVKPILDSYEGQKVQIVNTFYCYDDQDSQSYLMCVNYALYVKDKDVVRMSNFQAIASGAVVSNISK